VEITVEEMFGVDQRFASTQPIHSADLINIYGTDPSVILCEEIIQHSETNEWVTSKVRDEEESRVDLESRDSQQQSYPSWDCPDLHRPMMGFAAECLNAYLAMFPAANKFPSFSVSEHYQVVRYLDGGAYHGLHSDYYPYGFLNRRHLTGVAFLNDVAVGGELLFPQQNLSVKSEAGKFVIFPSGWTHSHKTLPPVGQSRYIFQVWWGFDEDVRVVDQLKDE